MWDCGSWRLHINRLSHLERLNQISLFGVFETITTKAGSGANHSIFILGCPPYRGRRGQQSIYSSTATGALIYHCMHFAPIVFLLSEWGANSPRRTEREGVYSMRAALSSTQSTFHGEWWLTGRTTLPSTQYLKELAWGYLRLRRCLILQAQHRVPWLPDNKSQSVSPQSLTWWLPYDYSYYEVVYYHSCRTGTLRQGAGVPYILDSISILLIFIGEKLLFYASSQKWCEGPILFDGLSNPRADLAKSQ
jgi:hypothetical protein